MKKLISLCLLFIIFWGNASSQVKNQVDIVYLKNGNTVRGFIIENTPNVEIKFKTLDGSLIIYSYDDFIKLGKEENTFRNKITREKINFEKETFIIGGVALHPSQRAGFLMAGKVKNYGGYLKLKTNLNFNGNFVSEGYSVSNRYFNDKIYTGRVAFTGGMLWRVVKPLILYGGLGYGNRWVNWETISGEKFRVIDISYKGLESEAGLIYKINKLFFTGGVSTISFKYMELNLGVGITL